MVNTKDKYKEDGVDVEEGDSFSAMAGEMCRRTFKNSPFVEVKDFSRGHFRGPRGFKLVNLPDGVYMDAAPDGIDTKVVVIDAAFAHRYACRDVIAMTSSDITRYGGLPLVFVNMLDVKSLGKAGSKTNDAFRSMIEGLGEVAKEQNLICFRGETAELGTCVGSENVSALATFNWGGFMLGIYHPNRMITGDSLELGQAVMALEEEGLRCNGYSLVRKALKMKFGDNWPNNLDASIHIKAAAKPAILYDHFLTDLNGWGNYKSGPRITIHSISHISGGGIVGKFAKDILFPRGLSAELGSLYDPPEIMKSVAEWRGMSERECYTTFNGGNGMLVVINQIDAEYFTEAAKDYGIRAKRCGEIVKRDEPSILIHSRFGGEILRYNQED